MRQGDQSSLGSDMAHETLAGEVALRIKLGCWQRQVVVGHRDVFGRRAEFDDFGAGRTFEDAVADLRRLQDAIAGIHDKRVALTFIDHPHPALAAEDGLKPELVEVDVVRHRSTIEDAEVRGDEGAAMALRQQITVAHTGATHTPLRVGGGAC